MKIRPCKGGIDFDHPLTITSSPPQIILSKGHDAGVDIWAFGVLLFEMIYGYSPFYSEGVDQVTLFKRIVQVHDDDIELEITAFDPSLYIIDDAIQARNTCVYTSHSVSP